MKTGRPDLDARIKVSEMPADEPWFPLRAQDSCADEAVRHYAQVVIARGGPIALAESALQQADAMSNWRVRKMPDIELPEADRLQLEYHHGRRPEVRDERLPVSHAYEAGVAAGVSRERRGRVWTADELTRAASAAFAANIAGMSHGLTRVATWAELPERTQDHWRSVVHAGFTAATARA